MTIAMLLLGTLLAGPPIAVISDGPPLLSSKKIFLTIPFPQVVSPRLRLETPKHPVSKPGHIFFIDFPLSPFWETVETKQIGSQTVSHGNSGNSWSRTMLFGGWPIPRIGLSTKNTSFRIEGGVMNGIDGDVERQMSQAVAVFNVSPWYFLFSGEGIFGQEDVVEVFKGLNFNADFRRRSLGGRGWAGIQVGSFAGNFLAIKYGQGYVRTEGFIKFDIDLDETDWLPLYLEDFFMESWSAGGQVRTKRFAQSVVVERIVYRRKDRSPDASRFGENRLEDLVLRGELEVVPLIRHKFLRFVVVGTRDFKGRNRLMFVNDYPIVKVLLRLAF